MALVTLKKKKTISRCSLYICVGSSTIIKTAFAPKSASPLDADKDICETSNAAQYTSVCFFQ